jgi:hypothetical protein
MDAEIAMALEAVRTCTSHDPVEIKALVDQWAIMSSTVDLIKAKAASAIDGRRAVMSDLAAQFGEDAAQASAEELGFDLDLADDDPEMEKYMNERTQI